MIIKIKIHGFNPRKHDCSALCFFIYVSDGDTTPLTKVLQNAGFSRILQKSGISVPILLTGF